MGCGNGARHLVGLFAAASIAVNGAVAAAEDGGELPEKVDFNRDIRPILSDTCFNCHGFDESSRQADLRLDTPDGFLADRGGYQPVVPGDAGASEVIRRITADDPADRMPPEDFERQLTGHQIALIERWIEQGADWEEHWAFITPQRPGPPTASDPDWPHNPIDHFVMAELDRRGLDPSPEADRTTLIRRVTYDLTGLPPTPEEVDAFLADDSPRAYEKVVDRLLESPRYGERMANHWLDLARYADTHGYHIDSERHMWRWRDWVIEAFNDNMPYDRFTIEQLAGDLLDEPSLDQLIATGFNRNAMINYEGGAIPEEYLTAYVVDRVNTTSTVWLGLTMACAQCHDHKYDPVTQKEYFEFFAYFNTIDEKGLDGRDGNAVPMMPAPTREQQAKEAALGERIATAEAVVDALEPRRAAEQREWEADVLEATPRVPVTDGLIAYYELDGHAADTSGNFRHGAWRDGEGAFAEGRRGAQAAEFDGEAYIDAGDAGDFEADDAFSWGAWVKRRGDGHVAFLSRMDDATDHRGWDLYLADGVPYVDLIDTWPDNAIQVKASRAIEQDRWHHVFATYDGSGEAGGVRLYVDGEPAEVEVVHDSLSGSIATSEPLRIGGRGTGARYRGMIEQARIYDRELSPDEVAEFADDGLRDALALAPEDRDDDQRRRVLRAFLDAAAPEDIREAHTTLASLREEQRALRDSFPTTMVMREMDEPRDTHVLIRGEYDQKGEKVSVGVPSALRPLPDDAPANRLGLARWLVDPDHPITARVTVNRFWQLIFGEGLVQTIEDFGAQGDWPSHPELLDWLAREFADGGWDVKAMMRLIVTSATYRQAADFRPDLEQLDPRNRLLARGPRFRLPAEAIRDTALAISGLLVGDIGGPSVKPYQPEGLWKELAIDPTGREFTAQVFEQDEGDALYRRSMYTFWKRTVPPPNLVAFDAPDREFCVAKREVTNTPLQALVLMNDPAFVEAARALAERMMREAGPEPADRAAFAFRLATARAPSSDESSVLVSVFEHQLAEFREDPSAAEELIAVGDSQPDAELDPVKLAAWTLVASMVLNLDETLTRG